MKIKPSMPIHLDSGGGTINISLVENYDHYYLYGSASLKGSWVIQPTPGDTPYEGMEIRFYCNLRIYASPHTVTVFGNALTPEQIDGLCEIICRYDDVANAWVTWVIPNSDATAWVTSTQIVNEAVTLGKMADLARGSIIVGGAADRPVALDAKTNAQILIGNGADVKSVAVTGVLTITNAGVTDLAADSVTRTHLNVNCAGAGNTQDGNGAIAVNPDTTNGTSIEATTDGTRLTGDQTNPGSLKHYGTNAAGVKGWYDESTITSEATITIPTADVLTLNSVPYQLLASPGVGKAYVVDEALMFIKYQTAAYATNTTLHVITDTAEIAQLVGSTYLATKKDVCVKLLEYGLTTKTQILSNKGIYAKVDVGDPTLGDSDVVIYLKYRLIDLTI